ncbi:hypothetical protein FNV43_RR06177 [Rhamnella rubrinervis]|uniref:Uncharacterized protein n=1 Tax=Rhamnella rubrinervis TaxID=2594499 RepID=A0A8K0ML82_9ROSA|nr:hypothetical protein FNV43_RR06177 [Rhamnella rubrinervis]
MANNNEADHNENTVESITTRRHGIGISKTFSTIQSASMTSNNAIHVPPPGRRKGRFRARPRSPPLPWQEKIFNASEHEVPSGPNPISNR